MCLCAVVHKALWCCVMHLLHSTKGELLKELDAERVTAMLACVPEGVPIEEVSVFSEAVAAFLIHHLPDPLVSLSKNPGSSQPQMHPLT